MTGVDIAHLLSTIRRRSRRFGFRFIIRKIMTSIFSQNGPTRFVILSFARTGSNWLCGQLFGHPEIFMHNEIFNSTGVHTYYYSLLGEWEHCLRDQMPQKFLERMFDLYLKDPTRNTKAIGFKSFPEHYMDGGRRHPDLEEVFTSFMSNWMVKKVILKREDVFAVYVSNVRARLTGYFMTKQYDDIKIVVDVAELQRFIDRYNDTYRKYRDLTSGQDTFYITYEDMSGPDHDYLMKKLLQFLQVTPTPTTSLKETVRQSSTKLVDSIVNYDEVEFAWRHTSYAKFLSARNSADAVSASLSSLSNLCDSNTSMNDNAVLNDEGKNYRWALLIPVSGARTNGLECRRLLQQLSSSLMETTSASDRKNLYCVFGIDEGDKFYDSSDSCEMITEIFSEFPVIIHILTDQHGKLCKIWNELGRQAILQGCDFMVLLGDDVILLNNGWKTGIEKEFRALSLETNLPFGIGCIAFRDVCYPGFPTFPVIHRSHVELFSRILPHEFINQGGDPYLFALYKRFKASKFSTQFSLKNTIGGCDSSSRYRKKHIRWTHEVLTKGLNQLGDFLQRKPFISIDLVVPTYRCNVDILKRIVSLRASNAIHIQMNFWIIVDNPNATNLTEVKALSTSNNYEDNYEVKVRVHPINLGVSAARNTGLEWSEADWVILLDDDVTPESNLLDAYIGAIMRHPDAQVFVGSTHFPPPNSLITNAFVASDLIGAYTIAERRNDPPWGVGANLCVRGRTSRLRFCTDYPFSGGGEDIDYCVRAAFGHHHRQPIVSVPGARVQHPWWDEGRLSSVRHVLAWGPGESLCMNASALKEHTYFTGPNGIEICMLLPFFSLSVYSSGWIENFSFFRLFQAMSCIFFLETVRHMLHVNHRVTQRMNKSFLGWITITIAAAWVIMLQEGGRFIAHIRSGAFQNIFWRLDWMCGKNPQYILISRVFMALRTVLYGIIVIICFCGYSFPPFASLSMLIQKSEL
jgi:glycosyltransferase involved in cell wall biosynthesis/LPS sulfotransferase NodH